MATSSTQSFGDKLRRYRLAAGLTQEELAARAGLSVRGLSDLERGARRAPRRETVQLLCEALLLSGAERVRLEAAARQRELRHPPTGMVTLLFADIEGSTDLLQQLGEHYTSLLSECRHLLRAVFRGYRGYEVDTKGDAFFAAFARATDAISAAVAAQRALATHPWPQVVMVRVRMGIHTGEPSFVSEGYVGLEVHQAARIMGAGHGEQVLLSQSTRDLVEQDLPEGVSLRDLGKHRLKDVERPIHLYQLVIADLPTDFPPLKTFESRPSNLPVQWTPLIGREQEVAAVQHLLSLESVRLVTLTGPGGTGKTRLGVQVATELIDLFPDGVYFVNLAPISDHVFVIPTIAQTLGLREVPAQSLLEHLMGIIQRQQLLLLLDNFEHVVSEAPKLIDLLAACPRLKLLVTSREVLRLPAEHLFPVPSLTLPDLAQLPKQEDLGQYAAVSLFVQRAQAIKPDFQLTSTNAHAIAEICVRLDGLPLAIELAAARIRLLPSQALLTRLSQRLQVLTGGSQTLPIRQQTLRNTIKWSYDLLNEEEQRLFRRLSVFVGGCTFEAAEAVCGTRSEGSTVLDSVASLIDKSLLHQLEQEGGEPRLAMLETIREYGLEVLATTGELETNRKEHAQYFLTLTEQAQLELHGPNQTVQLERLGREHDNLRAALEWTLEERADEPMRERSKLALQLSAALWEFWRINGYYHEGRTFLEHALAQSEGEDIALRAKALRAAANLAIWQGDHAGVEVLAQQGLALYRELGDTHGIVNCLFLLGGIAWRRGEIIKALTLYEERVNLLRHIGELWEVGQALYYLADLTSIHGEYARSQSLFEEALYLFRNIGNELWAGGTLVHSALWLYFSRGDLATIRRRLQEGQALITKVGNRHWSAECSWLTALLALGEGELVRASSLTKESLAIYREIGDPWHVALMLHTLGRVEAKRGEMAAAYSLYEESIALSRKQGEQFIVPLNLEGLAGILTSLGECRSAAHLWGAAEALREAIASPLPPFDRVDYAQMVATCRTKCGEQAFDSAWKEGRTMTLEQTLASQRRIEKPGPSPKVPP